ncbi:carbohydrate ABC transporter permease [Facklamia hominis]|uniref:carbohydrate ABC transporter permease n=1 Tax=Facklamia hominis TaxID=178214 RepID=UPI0003543D96|nr:sugar ABC transporter permease [Facklamia hominis]EPH13279.1 hypothetical protein HMPREF9260_00051 [Facklamia hominis ACS-120-V-Sch10]
MIQKKNFQAIYFLLPAMILLTILYAYPMFLLLVQSFQKVELFGAQSKFVAFDNYIRLLKDKGIYHNLRITLLYSCVTIAIKMLGGLMIALLINSDIYGKKLARFIMLIPWAIPQVAVSIIWKWIYDTRYGYLNYFLDAVNWVQGNIAWLADKDVTLYAVSIVDAWMGWPLITMMILAGLEAIPKSLYEAGRLDGANTWKQFWHITLPELAPVLTITFTLVSIWTFNSFNVIFVMTQGGPLRSTETLMMRVYNEAFKKFDFGMSSALSVLIILFMLAFISLYIRQLTKED